MYAHLVLYDVEVLSMYQVRCLLLIAYVSIYGIIIHLMFFPL